MRLRIQHHSLYRYAEPARRVVQALRLWPAPCAAQQVVEWRVLVQRRPVLARSVDGFGNPAASHGIEGPVAEVSVEVSGVVDTDDRYGVVGGTRETLPPAFYLQPTAITAPGEAVDGLLAELPEEAPLPTAHRLLQALHARIAFRVDASDAATTAEQALAQGAGVCQDHAHAMIAAARRRGIPARYVAGYLWLPGEEPATASHAWCELHLPDLGWVGFDAANRICPTDAYVRVAVGRDAQDAAPIRGQREGGVDEALEVRVQVQQAAQQ
jgi:transglutaminase-like putative cysteine protease